ncbi:MAG: protein kinase, partial [Acidobacteriota bacterium]
VVHRDLKPQNIFLLPGPHGEVVKLLDFGISKVLGSQSVMTGAFTLIGTPNYMSPEQAEGRNVEVDARTDVFALGAILYEMLAGRPAFAGDTIPSILFQVVHRDPVPLTQLRPDLPAAAAAAVAKALSKRKEGRQASMADLHQEFATGLEAGEGTKGALAATVMPLATIPASGFAATAGAPSAVELAPPAPRPVVETTLSSGAGEVIPAVSFSRRHGIAVVVAGLVGLAGVGLYYGLLRQPREVGTTAGGSPASASPSDAVRHLPATPPAAATRPSTAAALDARPLAPEAAERRDARQPAPSAGRLGVVVRLSKEPLDTSWAHVLLDDRTIDDAPFERRVAAGVHELQVHRPGFLTVKQTITILPGKRRTIVVLLRKR